MPATAGEIRQSVGRSVGLAVDARSAANGVLRDLSDEHPSRAALMAAVNLFERAIATLTSTEQQGD